MHVKWFSRFRKYNTLTFPLYQNSPFLSFLLLLLLLFFRESEASNDATIINNISGRIFIERVAVRCRVALHDNLVTNTWQGESLEGCNSNLFNRSSIIFRIALREVTSIHRWNIVQETPFFPASYHADQFRWVFPLPDDWLRVTPARFVRPVCESRLQNVKVDEKWL